MSPFTRTIRTLLGLRLSWFLALIPITSAFLITSVSAATIWTGPNVTRTKAAFADSTLEENQDRITDNVWLTRGNLQGLYNAKTEVAYTNAVSPADTEWALGSTDDIDSLTFDDFQGFVLGTFGSSQILQMIDQNVVLHLISDDIYIDFTLKDWGVANGGGGSFTYERSTPIPEPATGAMIGAMLSAFAARRRRRHV